MIPMVEEQVRTEQDVYASAFRHGIAVFEFWAPWCIYSLLLKPKTEAIAREYCSRVAVHRVNTDQHRQFAESLGIQYVPAVAFTDRGQVLETWYGDTPLHPLRRRIERYEPRRQQQ